MLVFNMSRVFKLRDIERPYSFLKKHGFGHMTASNYARNNVIQPHLYNIETLCRVLNCTPNDLFEWVPEEGKNAVAETHPLNTLQRDKKDGVRNLIKEIPLERLPEVEAFLKGMKE